MMHRNQAIASQRRRSIGEGAGLLFTGAVTPHDPATGQIITSTGCLPKEIEPAKVGLMFFDVPEYPVLSQTCAIYRSLAQLLAEHDLSLRNVVRQRLFIRDVRTLPAIERVMDIMLGPEKPATSIVVVPAASLHQDIHIYLDAIAARDRGSVRAVEGEAPSRYPAAMVAGEFVLTSGISGAAGQSAKLADDDLPLLRTARERRIYCEALRTFAGLEQTLARVGSKIQDVLKVNGWVDFAMREYGAVVLARRRYFDQSKDKMMASTGLAVGGCADPDAMLSFDAIALAGQARGTKDVSGRASPIASPYVAGAVKGGGLVFTSGEIPVLVPDGIVMDDCELLPEDGKLLRLGHIEPESGMESRAWYVYRTLQNYLRAFDTSFERVIHQTVFIEHPREFPTLERIATLFFGRTLPPTTVVPITDTTPFRTAQLEIEMVATAS